MKKEIIKKSIMLIVLAGLLIWYANLNATEKVTRNYEMKKDNQISIMVYDETAEDYVAQDTVPTGYMLDKERTYCVNGGEITSYDSATGVINYNLNTDDKCYVYLKPVPITFEIMHVLKCNGATEYSILQTNVFTIKQGSTWQEFIDNIKYHCIGGFVTDSYTAPVVLKELPNVVISCTEKILENGVYLVDESFNACY